jgi:hypothetical protein
MISTNDDRYVLQQRIQQFDAGEFNPALSNELEDFKVILQLKIDECPRESYEDAGFDMDGGDANVQDSGEQADVTSIDPTGEIQKEVVVYATRPHMNSTQAVPIAKAISKLSLKRKGNIPTATILVSEMGHREAGTYVIAPQHYVFGAESEMKAISGTQKDIIHGQPVRHKGLMVCVEGKKAQHDPKIGSHVYGILGASVPSESKTATCIMQDGTYRTFTKSVFAEGIARMDKEPFVSRCPVSHLEGWLRDKSAQANIFKLELAQSQQDFLKEEDSSMTITWTFDEAGNDVHEVRNNDGRPVREQLVIELSSDSDDETTRPVQPHVKSEVKVKVGSATVAVLAQQSEQMQK